MCSFWGGVTTGCLLSGLLPGFSSFQRLIYTKDTNVFLVTYLMFVISFIISVIGFVYMSIKYKFFIKTKHSIFIVLAYLLIFGLLSINAAIFTSLELVENGYNVPFNPVMYIIDLFIIFTLYGFFDYYVLKKVKEKLRRKNPTNY